MASSNIKLFDENKGNMLTDTEFNISTQRLNGLQTGVASSQLQNKAMYQASLVAYAIAQIMLQNGLNANDTDAVSAFVANLSGTILQKVHDIATTAEAQEGIATGKWMSPALVKAAIDAYVVPEINKKLNISDKATDEDITNKDGSKWVTASQLAAQIAMNYVPIYLAFVTSANEDSVSAALGKNNDGIKYVGQALSKYELFKDPASTPFVHLPTVNNMDELLANGEALIEVYSSTYVYALLMGNPYSKGLLDSSIGEAAFCVLTSALAGVPNYSSIDSYTKMAEVIADYSTGYIDAFSKVGNELYSIHEPGIQEAFFSLYTATQIFASASLINLCLDMTAFAKYMGDNPSLFVDAANASIFARNYSQTFTTNGTINATACSVKCFALSMSGGGSAGGQNCYANITQGMFISTLASNSNRNSVSWSGFAPCNYLKEQLYAAGMRQENIGVHAKYIPHT